MDRRPGQNLQPREREHLRARATELLVQGYTERQVAAELGISHSSVGRLWAKQRECWEEEHAALVERELEKLDYIEAEHWRAYQQSKMLILAEDSRAEAAAAVGDPEHLERVLAVMQERARRLGLYPARQLTSTVQSTEVRRVVIGPAPGADIDAYLAAIQRAISQPAAS